MDNDIKKSVDGVLPTDRQPTTNSGVNEPESSYPSVTPNEVPDIFAYVEQTQPNRKQLAEPPKTFLMADYFAHQLKADIAALQNYATRKTGFDNIDEQQFFSPGLYVIGALELFTKTAARKLFLKDKAKSIPATLPIRVKKSTRLKSNSLARFNSSALKIGKAPIMIVSSTNTVLMTTSSRVSTSIKLNLVKKCDLCKFLNARKMFKFIRRVY